CPSSAAKRISLIMAVICSIGLRLFSHLMIFSRHPNVAVLLSY
ncbi:hypothetical protein, partial [Methylomonas albis]